MTGQWHHVGQKKSRKRSATWACELRWDYVSGIFCFPQHDPVSCPFPCPRRPAEDITCVPPPRDLCGESLGFLRFGLAASACPSLLCRVWTLRFLLKYIWYSLVLTCVYRCRVRQVAPIIWYSHVFGLELVQAHATVGRQARPCCLITGRFPFVLRDGVQFSSSTRPWASLWGRLSSSARPGFHCRLRFRMPVHVVLEFACWLRMKYSSDPDLWGPRDGNVAFLAVHVSSSCTATFCQDAGARSPECPTGACSFQRAVWTLTCHRDDTGVSGRRVSWKPDEGKGSWFR